MPVRVPQHQRGCERQRVVQGHLPRRPREHYQSFAIVHWCFTTERRCTGWLDQAFHGRWLLVLLHACARYSLISPGFVLMPDHVHLLLAGIRASADQMLAINFLRRHTASTLMPATWQRQAYDHVLGDEERQHDAFATMLHYILENPVRAGLTPRWQEYDFVGNCIPGYPELDLKDEQYWWRMWRCYGYLARSRT